MSDVQTVQATFTVSLYFQLPKNADGEKLIDENRLYVKYGTLFLIDKYGKTVQIDPIELPDFKHPESVSIETDVYHEGLDIDGFTSDEESEDEEEDNDDDDDEKSEE